MALIFTKGGKWEVVPTQKKTRQGESKNTKFSPSSGNGRRKPYRGQGR